MTTATLVELTKIVNKDLIKGVAQDIITVDPLFAFLPFFGFTGDGISVNREDALGDAGFYGVGDTITHTNPMSRVKATFEATTLIGQADMNNLVQRQSVSGGSDMLAQELSSKAKSVGRSFRNGMITGDGTGDNMQSFQTLIDSSQYTTGGEGHPITFDILDELCDLILSKDGQVDFIMMARRTLRSLKALYRKLGGTMPMDVLEMPNGTQRQIWKYEDIPVFVNEFVSITEGEDGIADSGNLTSLWGGVFDDGTGKVGIAAMHPESSEANKANDLLEVQHVGPSETKDEEIWRVKMYANFINFNRRGLARAPSIND